MFTTNGQELLPEVAKAMKGVKAGSRRDRTMRKVIGKAMATINKLQKK